MLVYNDQLDFTSKRIEETYSTIIPDDNFWKKLNRMVDFNFVYKLLKDRFQTTTDKTEIDIIRLFKYLLLKSFYKLSDEELIEKTDTSLEFKYFLEYEPSDMDRLELKLITAFRKEKINKEDFDLIDKFYEKTVEIAREKGIDESTLSSCSSYNESDISDTTFTIEDVASIFLLNMKKIIEKELDELI